MLLLLFLNCTFIFLVSMATAQAQNHTVKRTVTDSTGAGLEDVSVKVEGAQKGAITDPNYPNFDYRKYFVRDYTPRCSRISR